MLRILLSSVFLVCGHVAPAENSPQSPDLPREGGKTRSLIAERIVSIDGQPTVLQVEIEAPAIDQDRSYSDAELVALLRRHVGRWFGKTRISLIDGRQVAEMITEQSYRMETRPDGQSVLRGTAVYANNGQLTHAWSESWIDDNTLFSRIEEQEENRTYVGRVQDSGETITWLPVVPKGEPHTEQITQYFGEHNGQPAIVTLGFRQHVRPEYETLLIIRGELVSQSDTHPPRSDSGESSGGRIQGSLNRTPVQEEEPE